MDSEFSSPRRKLLRGGMAAAASWLASPALAQLSSSPGSAPVRLRFFAPSGYLSDPARIETGINRLRTQVEARTIPASALSGYTISLSNFGMFAGRYATPVVVPPCVAIVGAGKLCHDVVAVIGGIEVHRRMPISLTFDHRACTGGEAARFLKALLDDLGLPQ